MNDTVLIVLIIVVAVVIILFMFRTTLARFFIRAGHDGIEAELEARENISAKNQSMSSKIENNPRGNISNNWVIGTGNKITKEQPDSAIENNIVIGNKQKIEDKLQKETRKKKELTCMIPSLLANCKKEIELFRQLSVDDLTQQRIVLFHGESGFGKTTLLNHCIHHVPIPSQINKIVFNFKHISLPLLLNSIGRVIGWENLPHFEAKFKAINKHASAPVNINRNLLVGRNQINVFLHSNFSYELAELSEALFLDFELLQNPVLFIIDTYEKASEEVKEWIEAYLLNWIASLRNLRVVIAGQTIPEETILWKQFSTTINLCGIPQEKDWLPIVKEIRPDLDDESVVFMLKIACKPNQGNPYLIKMSIDNLLD